MPQTSVADSQPLLQPKRTTADSKGEADLECNARTLGFRQKSGCLLDCASVAQNAAQLLNLAGPSQELREEKRRRSAAGEA